MLTVLNVGFHTVVGDWTKVHPEPEKLDGPVQCAHCKGTGYVLISV